ncbi:hypothetical protein OS187_00040 [Xanthomonadaceae bacterium JHOS43]|nr:hypothetical protein [Xanthomonadaceae bacterium JHOS43]MCX7563899.1 hypothetical protein [Xanthomonadaceae bacterium XH05]
MFSVRVKASTHEGWGELRGMLHFADARLRLQHQSNDAVLGLLKSRVMEQEIALEQLHRIVFRRGFLGLFPRIELHFADFVAASKLPATESAVLRLAIPWNERVRARELAEQVELTRALHRTEALESDIARLSAADPLSGLREAADAPRADSLRASSSE